VNDKNYDESPMRFLMMIMIMRGSCGFDMIVQSDVMGMRYDVGSGVSATLLVGVVSYFGVSLLTFSFLLRVRSFFFVE
jgi:hypothetical protein